MDDRARDAAGRPRNPRPRDAAGRPLPMGADGVERIPDDFVLPPDEALTEAQRLIDDGRPFHAHEVLEGSWKTSPPPERALWRALAQLAVGLTHLQRGNATGAVTLLRRAVTGLEGYDDPYGVDVAGLRATAGALADG